MTIAVYLLAFATGGLAGEVVYLCGRVRQLKQQLSDLHYDDGGRRP